VFQKAYEKGDIYKGLYEGWYCIPDETFLLESEVQEGKCSICGRPVEWITEEAYFFRLSHYQDWILEHIESHPTFIQPVSRRNEVLSFCVMACATSASAAALSPGDPGALIQARSSTSDRCPDQLPDGHWLWVDAQTFDKFWPANIHLIGKRSCVSMRSSGRFCYALRTSHPDAGLCPWLVDR
jgi:methionyl-tRNA synthetase